MTSDAPDGRVTVRPLTAAEWRTWRWIRLRTLAEAPQAFGTTLADAEREPEDTWIRGATPRPSHQLLVAERAGDPVGIARVELAPDGLRAGLYSTWVAPEARRCGAGGALVDAAIAWARAAGASELTLRVAEPQTAAIALYESRGFVDTGERDPLRPWATAEAAGPGAAIVCRGYRRALRVVVMGVVNVTPDSFSDGGQFLAADAAVAHGLGLLRDGADLLDVGGEATNPRAAPVSAEHELARVLPVVQRLAAAGATLSIDTTKAVVARAAVAAGATIINDVSGGLFDPDMSHSIGDATYIAGHLRGRSIADVFAPESTGEPGLDRPGGAARPLDWQTVADELAARLAGLPDGVRERAWLDPGLGFGKGADPEVNLGLLRHCGALGRRLGRPVVIGASRKRFVRRAYAVPEGDLAALDAASVAASLDAVAAGANVVRVHNVALLRAALALYTK